VEGFRRVGGNEGLAQEAATTRANPRQPAIFGAYTNLKWPEKRSSMDSVYAPARIADALEWAWTDLTRPENRDAWASLAQIAPLRSRIELFDMVWWVHFRLNEPVKPSSPI
jgi:hypothetical protein